MPVMILALFAFIAFEGYSLRAQVVARTPLLQAHANTLQLLQQKVSAQAATLHQLRSRRSQPVTDARGPGAYVSPTYQRDVDSRLVKLEARHSEVTANNPNRLMREISNLKRIVSLPERLDRLETIVKGRLNWNKEPFVGVRVRHECSEKQDVAEHYVCLDNFPPPEGGTCAHSCNCAIENMVPQFIHVHTHTCAGR